MALDQIVVGTQAHLHTGAGRGTVNASARHLMHVGKVCASERETGPTITAMLERGPLAGRRIDVDVVEGRPPKTIDLRGRRREQLSLLPRGLGPEGSVRDIHVLVPRIAGPRRLPLLLWRVTASGNMTTLLPLLFI